MKTSNNRSAWMFDVLILCNCLVRKFSFICFWVFGWPRVRIFCSDLYFVSQLCPLSHWRHTCNYKSITHQSGETTRYMTACVIILKLAPLLYFRKGSHRKMMTRKIWLWQSKWNQGIRLYYMEHVCMHMKGHVRGHGTSRSLKVMIKLQLVSVEMIKVVKVIFMSLWLAYFLIHLIMLIHD